MRMCSRPGYVGACYRGNVAHEQKHNKAISKPFTLRYQSTDNRSRCICHDSVFLFRDLICTCLVLRVHKGKTVPPNDIRFCPSLGQGSNPFQSWPIRKFLVYSRFVHLPVSFWSHVTVPYVIISFKLTHWPRRGTFLLHTGIVDRHWRSCIMHRISVLYDTECVAQTSRITTQGAQRSMC